MKHKVVKILFVAYMFFLVALHGQIFLYYDDYGYASLTYGNNVGTIGLNYGLGDILKYLWWHYFNWGGRVLYYFFEICSMKIGMGFIQCLQALILWGIGVVSYLLIREGKEQENICKAVMLIFAPGTLGLMILNRGLFWFSASVAYVWPLLPLLLLVYIRGHQKNSGRGATLCGVAVAFFAAFSYEQIAVLTLVYMAVSFAIRKVRKEIERQDLWILATVVIGAMLQLLAPGNFVRSASSRYDAFGSLNIFEKIFSNLPTLLEMNFGKDNKFFVIVLVLTGFSAMWYNCHRKMKSQIEIWGNTVIYVVFSFLLFLTWYLELPGILCNGGRAIWCILFSVYMITMLWKTEKYDLVALFIGGLCSVAMMLVAPIIAERCMLPFDFTVIVAMAAVMRFKAKPELVIACMTAVMGITNMSDIATGYHDNLVINRINDSKLREKSMRMAAGEEINTIILYKLLDDAYASEMPYQKDFMEEWIKNYYEIPQSVEFVWEDINGGGMYGEVVTCDIPKIQSIYPEKLDETVQFNEDGSLNIGVIPEIMSDSLIILINGSEYHTVIDKGFVSTCVPTGILKSGYLEISLIDKTSGRISDSVMWGERQ